jgi:predicted TIM-barrel fold metal-dependent hydrolase
VVSADGDSDSKEKKEWKRRIKMYRTLEIPYMRNVYDMLFTVGPVLEAFGFQRIIFGSSPSTGPRPTSHAGDWYEIARECLAELNVEQEAIDGVFSENARSVYGPS